MTLIKYYRPEFGLKSIDKFFEHFNADLNASSEENSYTPETDIIETENAFTINLSVPGIKKEDVKIELDKDNLVVTGERKLDSDVSLRFHKQQMAYGKFSQAFHLPQSVNKDAINAKQEDGILSIILEKNEKKEIKSIIEIK